MTKFIFAFLTALMVMGFQTSARADYATTPHPYPQPAHPNYPPYYGPYPGPAYPVYPQPGPWVTCFAQGLANGAMFYGVGLNTYAASQWAMYACNSSGQYCQVTGCRF